MEMGEDKTVQEKDESSYKCHYFDGCTKHNDMMKRDTAGNPEKLDCIDKHEVYNQIKILGKQAHVSSAREIINSSRMGIALYKYDPEEGIFKFEIWNQGCVDITGYSFDDVNNERLKSEKDQIILHRQAFLGLMEELEQNPGTVAVREKDISSAQGTKKTVSFASTGINRNDGFYILSIIKDITVEREMEKRIKESEAKFKKFFELSPEASFIYNKDAILLVNNAAVRLLGYSSKEELIGRSILEIVHDEYKKAAEMRINKTEFPAGQTYPSKLITHYGHIIDIEIEIAVLDYEGKKALHTSVRDVTKRNEFERRLRKSEEGYRRIVNLLPDPVYVYDGTKIIYVNASLLRFMDAGDESELIGKSHRELVNLDRSMLAFFQGLLHKVTYTDSTGTWEGRLVRNKDRKQLYISLSIIKIPSDTNSEYMIMIKDLEELEKNEELKLKYDENMRRLEEAIEYDKLRTEFFANLSHELRTPINVILGAAQMCNITVNSYKQLSEDERLGKYLNIIKQNCLRLTKMVTNLLDITRIDFGYFNMKYGKEDIVSAVENITMSVSEYVQNKGIQLIFDTDTEEKLMVFDYEKLERILLNLLSNAVKFTESGGCIYVNITNDATHVYIGVKDTGIGIPENMKDKIFERFVQVDKSLSRNAEGSGIGLALVKSLVEMHEGSVTLESSPGEGSKFVVKLPCNLEESMDLSLRYVSKGDECLENAKVEFSDIYF